MSPKLAYLVRTVVRVLCRTWLEYESLTSRGTFCDGSSPRQNKGRQSLFEKDLHDENQDMVG